MATPGLRDAWTAQRNGFTATSKIPLAIVARETT